MKKLLPLMALLGGCATAPVLPECERFAAQAAVIEGETYIFLDSKNTGKLSALLTGLRDGTCGMPKE